MSQSLVQKGSPLVCYIGEDTRIGALLKERLAKNGIASISAARVDTALLLAKRSRPRVILVDERLGGRDSISVALALRRIFPREEVALIWYTAPPTHEAVLAATHVGFDAILIRPLTFTTLIKRINQCLGKGEDIPFEPEKGFPSGITPAEIFAKLSQIKTLKSLPQVVERVLQITSGDESNARELAHVIQCDPHITAVILKYANSSYYGSSRKIGTVPDAIVRIGFQEVRAIVLGVSVIDLVPRKQRNLNFDRIEFWKASLATAVAARRLSEATSEANPSDAFVAGLLHDLGRIILDEYFPEEFFQAIELAEQHRITLLEAEGKLFGFDHQFVGKEVMDRWNFPKHLVTVAGCHEKPELIHALTPPSVANLAKIVWAAQWLTRLLAIGSSGERLISYDISTSREILAKLKGQSKEFVTNLYSEVRHLVSFMGIQIRETKKERASDGRSVAIFEETSIPISPLELLFQEASFITQNIANLDQLHQAQPQTLFTLEFSSLSSFQSSLPRIANGKHAQLIVLPRGELPADDLVKRRMGLPVDHTVYLEKPIHTDEFREALHHLLALPMQPA